MSGARVRFLPEVRRQASDTLSGLLLLTCLVPSNPAWARNAPLWILSFARTAFAANGQPNSHAFHVVGAATAQMALQAMASGLAVHAMAEIDIEPIRTEYALPEGVELIAGIAAGWPGDPETLPERQRQRGRAPRTRKSLEEVVLGG